MRANPHSNPVYTSPGESNSLGHPKPGRLSDLLLHRLEKVHDCLWYVDDVRKLPIPPQLRMGFLLVPARNNND